MQNPFESGHIKNYILFYVSVVVIMVLFFTASTLFIDIKSVDKKIFKTDLNNSNQVVRTIQEDKQDSTKFKLLNRTY